jgi:hypothetical protein
MPLRRRVPLDLAQVKSAKQRAFLAAYAQLGNITSAAARAKVGRRSHYEWLAAPAYAAAFVEAHEAAGDRLEAEAHRRAVQGVKEPVYQGGERVGYIQKFSDTLLIFLLKGARPEKYRERFDLSHRFDLSGLSIEELQQLRTLTAKLERRAPLALPPAPPSVVAGPPPPASLNGHGPSTNGDGPSANGDAAA